MKSIIISLSVLAIVACGYLVLRDGDTAEAQATSPPYLNSNTSVTWDAVTKDAAGGAETLRDYDLGIFSAGVAPNAAGVTPLATISRTPLPPVAGLSIAPLLAGRVAGSYQLAVRATDAAGNVGAWSSTLPFAFDVTPPAAPGNLRVIVTVSILIEPERIGPPPITQ